MPITYCHNHTLSTLVRVSCLVETWTLADRVIAPYRKGVAMIKPWVTDLARLRTKLAAATMMGVSLNEEDAQNLEDLEFKSLMRRVRAKAALKK